MAFVAQNFAVTPSEAQFRALLKSDLLKLAKHFNLEVRTNLRKAELQATVIQSMVGLGTWDELAWEWLPEEPEDVELRKLELQLRSQERIKEEERKAEKERAEEERKAEKERAEEERKAEKERAEEERKAEERREEKQAEERRVERELQERLAEEERKAEKERAEEERKAEERREEKQAEERRGERELQERLEGRKAEERRAARDLEAEERKAERELKERDMELQQEIKFKELELMRERGEAPPLLTGSTPNQKTWDVGRHVRLVPPFSEKEVAKFFPHFEKVARQLNWPEEAWTILVQSVLVGKAQEIYSALPMDQCADYEVLKTHILKAYELVPEAYRQKFRNARKRESETHVEFARVKENMFDRWCESKGVGKDFETLRDLILVEEFQQCVHEDIKVYLQEKKVPKLWDAATMADDYALTHRIGVHKPNSSPRLQQGTPGGTEHPVRRTTLHGGGLEMIMGTTMIPHLFKIRGMRAQDKLIVRGARGRPRVFPPGLLALFARNLDT
uniref:trichohyalin-like n=1 Tax=Myxine glutinosa TaxID=7769 RepID=UPI00358E029A